MKVFLICVFCALVGYAAGGSVGWPGAVTLSAPLSASVVKTVIPGETKTTAYSTTQYINAIPASYSFGAHPQLTYQVAQVNSFAPLPTGYYSIANPSYIHPATNIFYPAQPSLIPTFGAFPALPSAPLSPSTPAPINPAFPSQIPSTDNPQTAGDADSAVIDSIEFSSQQQQGQFGSQTTNGIQLAGPQSPPFNNFNQESGQFPSFPSNPQTTQNQQPSEPSFPQYTQNPQVSQNPQVPQFPQEESPAFPSIPQIPQAPQIPQTPQIPQNPQMPQNPQESAPSFPPFSQIPHNPLIPAQAPPAISQTPQPGQSPSFPQYPQFPPNIFPQGPSQSASASFPAPTNNDSSFNDEDTVSVESA